MLRAIIDYVVGFVLLAGGIGLLSAPGAVVKAVGVVCIIVGALLIVGRLVAGARSEP